MASIEQRWYSDAPVPWYLKCLEPVYRVLSAVDRRRKRAASWRAPVPVIVVGNITVGGTGKTPMVSWLVELLREAGYKPGIVSRGYKAKPPSFPWLVSTRDEPGVAGDEPLMLARRCQCPLVIDPDRSRAARLLLEKTDCDLIISDDGLQHLSLARDIELVILDGARGIGNGRCLPAGPLREPAERLRSVDFVISNGEPRCTLPRTDFIMTLAPQRFHTLAGEQLALSHFEGQTVDAVAGIGNPQRFFDTLSHLDISVNGHAFADHHTYERQELLFSPQKPLLTTEKDAVKWQSLDLPDAAWLEIRAVLPDPFAQALLAKLKELN